MDENDDKKQQNLDDNVTEFDNIRVNSSIYPSSNACFCTLFVYIQISQITHKSLRASVFCIKRLKIENKIKIIKMIKLMQRRGSKLQLGLPNQKKNTKSTKKTNQITKFN